MITLGGLALRLDSFGDSLFGDELSAYYVVAGNSFGQMMHLLNNHSTELNPPLFFILAWLTERLFGASAESFKLVSLVAGTATIPLTFALGRRTVGVWAAVVGSALVACCPSLIFYSTEARPYALLVVLLLLSTLAMLRALRSGGLGWWGAYAAFAGVAAYTHFSAIFVLAVQLIWALVTRPECRRAALTASAAAGIAYLPWVPVLIKTSGSPGTKLYAFLQPFTFQSIRIDLGQWSIGHPYLPLSVVPGMMPALLALVAIVAALIPLAFGGLRDLRSRPRPRCSDSIWFSRNLISSWPAFGLLLGAVVTHTQPGWRAAATALLVAAFVFGGLAMLPGWHHRPEYQAAIAYVDSVDPKHGPIADLVAPTPGPPSETDVALAFAGAVRAHPVFRIGVAPRARVIAARPYAPLSPEPGEVVAREAAAAAGNGLLFIIAPTSVPIAHLEFTRRGHIHSTASALLIFSSFLGALPPRFRPVTARTFPGFAPVTVYVYRRRPDSRPGH